MAKFIKVNGDFIINIDYITHLYKSDISCWLHTTDDAIRLPKEEYDRISKILLEAENE